VTELLGTRVINGVDLPAAGEWAIDRSHSSVEFSVRHLMVAKVRGHFAHFAGTIRVAEAPQESQVEVTVDAASLDTGDPQRDEHLRSPDFLDVERYPTLTFRSARLEGAGRQFRLHGELTIRGATRPVAVDVEYLGVVVDPWGRQRAVFSAATEIDREDFGLTWNAALETGGVLVGRNVRIEAEVEAVRQ
jgi:polyisoprenoid-binding protein YceI